MHYTIPACYFPTTVLFIDDSRDFLLNFVLQLDEGLAYRIYDSPFDALDFLQKKADKPNPLIERCLSAKPQTSSALANLQCIYSEIYNERRFAEVSVLVVDYAMPGMDGLEVCRMLKDSPIKKILLTGKADEKLAVEAFNKGLIDRYIDKNDHQAAELITKNIEVLQQQYFQSLSDKLTAFLGISPSQWTDNEMIQDCFRQINKEKRIVEYYRIDCEGSFLLLDEDAHAHLLTIRNEKEWELQDAYQRLNLERNDILSYHQHLDAIDAEELLLI